MFCRTTGSQGLSSLQGRDKTVSELLQHMEGMGLLDAYLIDVERCENRGGCLGDADLADFDHCECDWLLDEARWQQPLF